MDCTLNVDSEAFVGTLLLEKYKITKRITFEGQFSITYEVETIYREIMLAKITKNEEMSLKEGRILTKLNMEHNRHEVFPKIYGGGNFIDEKG